MQLETGISINRYLPAIGTAGLLRDLVSGKRRVPRPPPRISEMTRGMQTTPSILARDREPRSGNGLARVAGLTVHTSIVHGARAVREIKAASYCLPVEPGMAGRDGGRRP